MADDEDERVDRDALRFLIKDPRMKHRRTHFTTQELINMIAAQLVESGMDEGKLDDTRWVWVTTSQGVPELYLIFPGIEA